MKNFLLNFINSIFSLQEKFLEGKYQKKLNALDVDKNSMYKSRISSGASLTLSMKLEQNKQRINDEVKKLAKENINNLENLLMYAKERGTKFYVLKNAEKLLKPINEEIGLIFPLKGMRALYLNLLTLKKISFTTDLMFVFDDEKLSVYKVLYNFYKWYAFKVNLPGFDEKSLSEIKNLEKFDNPENLDKLTYNDIMDLKQAIARDREAMEFVLNFTKEIEGAKKAYDVMKNKEGGASL